MTEQITSIKKVKTRKKRRVLLYISAGMLLGVLGISLYGVTLNQAAITFSVNPVTVNLPPSSEFPLGTDAFGRNLVDIIPIAIMNDMYVTISAGLVVSALGILVGSLAAIFRGKIEEILMRTTDVFLAVPALVLALAIAGTFGNSFFDLIVALSVAGWSHLARIARSEVLTELNKPYVETLTVLGFGKSRILFRHVLRNISFFLASVIFLTLAALVTFLASLEYVGFSIGSLSPELGALIAQSQPYIFVDPWLLIISAAFLIFIIVTFMLLSDVLRYFDPRRNV